MSIVPTNQHPSHSPEFLPPECLPDYDSLITEDDKPVDSWYAERQHRLLTDALYSSWQVPGGKRHLAATDVGLFYSADEPAYSPDVMVSLDVDPPEGNVWEKKNRSYFIWRMGKAPDCVVEVVSNTVGGELTTKLEGYARIRVSYYVVWDPNCHLGEQKLHCFRLEGSKYAPTQAWIPDLELGVTTWDGDYDGMTNQWLRWCDRAGQILATGVERARAAEQLAKGESLRAEASEQRAAKLAEKLRALGIDPEA